MRYIVHCPTYGTFTARGDFRLIPVGVQLVPMINIGPRVLLLDPRAIVEAGDRVLYSPRRNLDGLSVEMRRWLEENPDWAVKT